MVDEGPCRSAATAQAVLFGGVAVLEAAVEVAAVDARVPAGLQVERALPPALLRDLGVDEGESPQHGEEAKGSHHHRGLHCGSSCRATSCSRRASGPCRRPTPSGPSKPIRQSEGSKRRSPARCETEDEISTPCADTSARGTRPWMPDLRIQGSAARAELPSGRSVALVARTLLGSSGPWTLIDGFRARQSASPAWASSARDCCSLPCSRPARRH